MQELNVRRRPYFFALSALLFLFSLRVVGQLLVFLFKPSFLPPMHEWYSGLIPYGPLLICQFAIILLFGKICIDFAGLGGFFSRANAAFAKNLSRFATVYAASMILRYLIQMTLHPELRWFGSSIPIAFHLVLASFLLLLGNYHHRAVSAERIREKLKLSTNRKEFLHAQVCIK
ncbi:MAG: hypothetical protein K2X27_23630 [Candidatus Obscuribacterales bacterium]|nr:hypothetical protein [Candidatus Obscuribacterales bacterium]